VIDVSSLILDCAQVFTTRDIILALSVVASATFWHIVGFQSFCLFVVCDNHSDVKL